MAAVFVTGFDYNTPENIIHDHFSACGEVTDIRYVGAGAAVVTYSSMSDASRAVDELNETTMEGNFRYVNVRLDGKGKGKGRDKGKGKGYGGYDGGMVPFNDRGKGKVGGKYDNTRVSYSGDLQEGTVSSFFDEKGFGFVTPDSGGPDVYVHFSAIRSDGYRSLYQGQAVRFGIGEDPMGPRFAKGKEKGGKAVYVEAC